MSKNLSVEESIKKFHGTINSKCPICNELLYTSMSIFKSNDVGFHLGCIGGKSEDEINIF